MLIPKQIPNYEKIQHQLLKLSIIHKLGVNVGKTHEEELINIVSVVLHFIYTDVCKHKILFKKLNSIKRYSYISDKINHIFNDSSLFSVQVRYYKESKYWFDIKINDIKFGSINIDADANIHYTVKSNSNKLQQ